MSINRKLQAEIDRLLKKVTEGCEEFDNILNKVYGASNSNQKEKYEADLKKEIKKLQRCRDQIKAWISSNDVKLKEALVDARKKIEERMEQFKACEKDSKTKAFSKEGLSQAMHQDDGKSEARNWIAKSLKELNAQIDLFETELETAQTKKATARIKKLQDSIKRHKFHLNKLERILRHLENDSLSNEQVMDIKDSIDYYIESSQEEDFLEDETVYDSLNLPEDDSLLFNSDVEDSSLSEDGESDEKEEKKEISRSQDASPPPKPVTPAKAPAPSAAPAKKPQEQPPAARSASTSSIKEEKAHPPSGGAPAQSQQQYQILTGTSNPTKPSTITRSATQDSTSWGPSRPEAVHVAPPATAKAAVASKPAPAVASSSAPTAPSSERKSTPAVPATPVQPTPAQPAQPQPVQQQPVAQPQAPSQPQAQPAQSQQPGMNTAQRIMRAQSQAVIPQNRSQKDEVPQGQFLRSTSSAEDVHAQPRPTAVVYPPGLTATESAEKKIRPVISPQPQAQPSIGTSTPAVNAANPAFRPERFVEREDFKNVETFEGIPSGSDPGTIEQLAWTTQEKLVHPAPTTLLPFEPSLQEPLSAAMTMMDLSMKNLPEALEADRPKQYTPRYPFATPAYYPSAPLPIFENPSLFEKFDIDTLFYIFYYQQGTYQQHLAAKELKKQSWRFHKKYLTWFQRHEEPREITPMFEKGTYVYFDFESGWVQRKKSEFVFEYQYLEDE